MRSIPSAICFLVIACLGFSTFAARETPQTVEIKGIKVGVWLPDASQRKPWPVIIFSHEFRGCMTQSAFLMQALARAGYAVFAPNHRDAACGDVSRWADRPEMPFGDPREWDSATYADRMQDIKVLLGLLPRDPRYGSVSFDWTRVGLAGHSLGGYTALALVGGWQQWKDVRVRAVLALSPYTNPFMAQKTLRYIVVPVMYQGGTRDFGITPGIKKDGGAYDQTPAPKYFVEFEGAGHFAWADINPLHHALIEKYSIAFFDSALKDKPFPAELAQAQKGVSDVRMEMGR